MKNVVNYKCLILIALAMIAAAVYVSRSSAGCIGEPLPASIAASLRGGTEACGSFKTAECREVTQPSDFSSCPALTYYYAADEGEYVKNAGDDYCGTQREGSPDVYDCASVMVDTAGCAK